MKLFQFSRSTLSFLNHGAPVKAPIVKAAANAAVLETRDVLQKRANELVQQAFKNGRFTKAEIAAWLADTKVAITNLQIANFALAYGGIDQIDDATWKKIAFEANRQAAVAERIANRALSGGYGSKLESRRWLQHAGNLANAGRSSYENARVLNASDRLGHDEFKRVLGGSDHCQTSASGIIGCVEAADMGWVTADELIPIGGCACHDNCNCTIISRRSGQSARLGF